jgi:hypothetical protein
MQTGSHPLGSRPACGFFAYLHQSIGGLGQFFSAVSGSLLAVTSNLALGFGLVVFAIWGTVTARKPEHYPEKIPFLLVAASYLCLLLLFNLTWINDPFSGRFLWFLPLCLMPAICLVLSRSPAWCLILLCPLLLGFPTYRVLRYGATGIVSSGRVADSSFVRIRVCYLLTTKESGFLAKWVRVRPPTFPWMFRWKKGVPPAAQETVQFINSDFLPPNPAGNTQSEVPP